MYICSYYYTVIISTRQIYQLFELNGVFSSGNKATLKLKEWNNIRQLQ